MPQIKTLHSTSRLHMSRSEKWSRMAHIPLPPPQIVPCPSLSPLCPTLPAALPSAAAAQMKSQATNSPMYSSEKNWYHHHYSLLHT